MLGFLASVAIRLEKENMSDIGVDNEVAVSNMDSAVRPEDDEDTANIEKVGLLNS